MGRLTAADRLHQAIASLDFACSRKTWSRQATLSSKPDVAHFSLKSGQLLKIRFDLPEPPPDNSVTVAFAQTTFSPDGTWVSGPVLKEYANVGNGRIVRFRSPSAGTYQMAVRSEDGRTIAKARIDASGLRPGQYVSSLDPPARA